MGLTTLVALAVILSIASVNAIDLRLHRVIPALSGVEDTPLKALQGEVAAYAGSAFGASRIAAVDVSALSADNVAEALAASSKAVIFMIPAEVSTGVQATLDALDAAIQGAATKGDALPPMFVAPASQNATEVSAMINNGAGPMATPYLKVVDTLKKATDVNVPVLSATFGVSEKTGKRSSAKRATSVLLVSHADVLGLTPSATTGGSSGATALMELSRLTGAANVTSATVKFLLSTAGRFSYFGTKEHLMAQDVKYADSLDAVLCLEDLLVEGDDDNKLYLHLSTKPKSEEAKQFVDAVVEAGKSAGVTVEVVVRKIDIAGSEMLWEHEPFAFKKMVAGTLSARRAATRQSTRSPLRGAAGSQEVNEKTVEALAERVNVVSKFLAAFAQAELGRPNRAHLRAWETFHGRYPRPQLELTAESPVIATYKNAFQQHGAGSKTASVSLKTYKMVTSKAGLTLWAPLAVDAVIVASLGSTAELMVTGAIFAYAFLVGVAHFGVSQTIGIFTAPFGAKKKRN